MEYSVEDLSKLAQVSVRTLHYYDEIGLLKPAFRMANGRRYYGVKELLILFDVIFFKRIGFSLKKIKAMLTVRDINKKALMEAKKKYLQKEIKRMKDLIKLIDDSTFYFERENMKEEEVIKQFEFFQKNTKEYKKRFEKEFGILKDEENEKILKMSIEEQRKYYEDLMSGVDIKLYKERVNTCMKKIFEMIENNKKEDSKEVQSLMKDYFEAVSMVRPISKKKWLGMALNIGENMDNYIVWAKLHPKLPEFLYKAMKIYGDKIKE